VTEDGDRRSEAFSKERLGCTGGEDGKRWGGWEVKKKKNNNQKPKTKNHQKEKKKTTTKKRYETNQKSSKKRGFFLVAPLKSTFGEGKD